MANIQNFQTPALDLRPTEEGINTIAGNARRVGTFYHEGAGALEGLAATEKNAFGSAGRALGGGIEAAGDAYVNYLDHKEISAGAAKGTQLMSTLSDAWNRTISDPKIDPNDPTIKQKFMEQNLEPALQQFKEDSGFFTTDKSQQFAEQFVERFRQHMSDKTSADMSTLAGVALKVNVQKTINGFSSMVASDPSSVDFALKSVDHAIGAKVSSSPTLDATTAASVRGELGLKAQMDIVKSAAIGAIQKSQDPEKTAEEWTKKYPDLINGQEAKMFAGYARQQLRAQNYDYELNRRREKEVAQDKSTEATNQYIIDVRSQDPKIANDPTGKKILNDPTLTKADKNNLLNYVDRQLKPETDTRTSSTTFVNLLRDLRAPDMDPDQTMQRAWDARLKEPGQAGSLSEKDFNQFRAEVVARKTPEGAALEHDRGLFFKNYAGAIAGNTYNPSIGDPKLYNAEQDARRMESMLKQKGLDPHLAYDPSSEYFLGRNERIAKWAGGMQQDLATRAEPGAKTAQPEVPFPLRGVADLSRNKKTGQYRDNATGKLFAADGSEIKP